MTKEELAHFFLALQVKNDLPEGASADEFSPAFGIPDMYYMDLADSVMKTGKLNVDSYCKLNRDPLDLTKHFIFDGHFHGQFDHKIVTLDAIDNGFKAHPQDFLSITTTEAERLMKGIIYEDYSGFKTPDQVWEETERRLKDNPGNIDVAKEVILERLEAKRVYALTGWYADRYNYLMYVDHKFILGSLHDEAYEDYVDSFCYFEENKRKGISDMQDCEYIPDELYCTVAEQMKPFDDTEKYVGYWAKGNYYNFECLWQFVNHGDWECADDEYYYTEEGHIRAFSSVHVPTYGRAMTKGGEIIRAMSQLQGRYSSHGDRFYMGNKDSVLAGPSSTYASYSFLHNRGCANFENYFNYQMFLEKTWSIVSDYLVELGAEAYDSSEEDSRYASCDDNEVRPYPLSADFDDGFPAPWDDNIWIKFECYGGENFFDNNLFCVSYPIEDSYFGPNFCINLSHFSDAKILGIKIPEGFLPVLGEEDNSHRELDLNRRPVVSGTWFDSTAIIADNSFHDDVFGKDRDEGISFYSKGEFDSAIKILSGLVHPSSPYGGDVISMRILGLCYNEIGNQDKALHYWNKAASRGDATSIRVLGEQFCSEGRYYQAKICFDIAKEHVDIPWNLYAESLEACGLYEEAENARVEADKTGA